MTAHCPAWESHDALEDTLMMVLGDDTADWTAVPEAVTRELLLRNRLMPRRWDYGVLAAHVGVVEAWIRPQLRAGPTGHAASVVLVDKDRRGGRPLHTMTLVDRVLYRLLVNAIAAGLPEPIRTRSPIETFRRAPLADAQARYVVTTDVTAYYEYVDHTVLRDELLDQTGLDAPISALTDVLGSVMGRAVGIPQVHPSSDILGDTYIDPIRRRLVRRSVPTFTYADDFRLTATTLGEARAALEACSTEVRARGLVLNERKTFTYSRSRYEASLDSFARAEQRLFEDDDDDPVDLFLLGSGYDDPDDDDPLTLGGPQGDLTEDEALTDDAAAATTETDGSADEVDPRKARAVSRAWDLWADDTDEDAAIRQSLLGRALPTLAQLADSRPLDRAQDILRSNPALTPQVAQYLLGYARNGRRARTAVREVIDDVTSSDVLSSWQQMWMADVAGSMRRTANPREYETWLHDKVGDRHDGVAATAAAALGRFGRGDARVIAARLDSLGPEWRTLAFHGLASLDSSLAATVADGLLERQLVVATRHR